jgi:hypothetical protein
MIIWFIVKLISFSLYTRKESNKKGLIFLYQPGPTTQELCAMKVSCTVLNKRKEWVIFLFDSNSPSPVIAFLYVVSKVACLALVTPICNILFSFSVDQWHFILEILVISNMILSNPVAITQMSRKCKLAHSSISQIGCLMIRIIAGDHNLFPWSSPKMSS